MNKHKDDLVIIKDYICSMILEINQEKISNNGLSLILLNIANILSTGFLAIVTALEKRDISIKDE